MNLTKFMYDAGIRRLRFSAPFEFVVDGESLRIDEIELFDTIPAPPPFVDEFTSPDEVETKPEGICEAKGCGEKNGWRFAPMFCRKHGLLEAGVSSR